MAKLFYCFFKPCAFFCNATDSESFQPMLSESNTYGSSLSSMFSSLLIISVLLFVGLFILKKILRRGKKGAWGNGIKIIERKALTPKSFLYLVDIYGKVIVIAESPQGIHLITEFPEGTDIYAMLSEEEKTQSSFKQVLQNKIRSAMFRKKNEP
jgi:flagellar biogenesis protein FliO